jgi:hypothetical protein
MWSIRGGSVMTEISEPHGSTYRIRRKSLAQEARPRFRSGESVWRILAAESSPRSAALR